MGVKHWGTICKVDSWSWGQMISGHVYLRLIKRESRGVFTAQRREGTLVQWRTRTHQESEEKHFKRFQTKDKAEIEALRDAHQRHWNHKVQDFWFSVFYAVRRNDSLRLNADKSQLYWRTRVKFININVFIFQQCSSTLPPCLQKIHWKERFEFDASQEKKKYHTVTQAR